MTHDEIADGAVKGWLESQPQSQLNENFKAQIDDLYSVCKCLMCLIVVEFITVMTIIWAVLR